jgi:hypothetical protein
MGTPNKYYVSSNASCSHEDKFLVMSERIREFKPRRPVQLRGILKRADGSGLTSPYSNQKNTGCFTVAEG